MHLLGFHLIVVLYDVETPNFYRVGCGMLLCITRTRVMSINVEKRILFASQEVYIVCHCCWYASNSLMSQSKRLVLANSLAWRELFVMSTARSSSVKWLRLSPAGTACVYWRTNPVDGTSQPAGPVCTLTSLPIIGNQSLAKLAEFKFGYV